MSPKEVACDLVSSWMHTGLDPEIPVETKLKLQKWGYPENEDSFMQSDCWDKRMVANLFASLNFHWKKDRQKFEEIVAAFEKVEVRENYREVYLRNSQNGIIGRGNSWKKIETWNSPTITYGTPERGIRTANWLHEYKDIFKDGSIIELGSGPDFNLLETAKLNIFSQLIGVDALDVRETFLERGMEQVSKAVDIDKHILELDGYSVKHIRHDVMKMGELKHLLPELKRPVTILITNFLIYYSREKVRMLLENVSGVISPEYLVISEHLKNQGLKNSIDTSFSLVCRLDNSYQMAGI